jgi:hypothetical protein
VRGKTRRGSPHRYPYGTIFRRSDNDRCQDELRHCSKHHKTTPTMDKTEDGILRKIGFRVECHLYFTSDVFVTNIY